MRPLCVSVHPLIQQIVLSVHRVPCDSPAAGTHTVPTLLSSRSRRGATYEQVNVIDRIVTKISKLEVVRPGISEEVIIERDGKEKPWEGPGQQKREPRALHMRAARI